MDTRDICAMCMQVLKCYACMYEHLLSFSLMLCITVLMAPEPKVSRQWQNSSNTSFGILLFSLHLKLDS